MFWWLTTGSIFPDIIYSSLCRLDPDCYVFPHQSFLLLMFAVLPGPPKISLVLSISFMSVLPSSFVQLFFLDISIIFSIISLNNIYLLMGRLFILLPLRKYLLTLELSIGSLYCVINTSKSYITACLFLTYNWFMFSLNEKLYSIYSIIYHYEQHCHYIYLYSVLSNYILFSWNYRLRIDLSNVGSRIHYIIDFMTIRDRNCS